jgi:hypothetical protein
MKVSDIFSMGGGGCDHGDHGDHGHRGFSRDDDHNHDRFDGGHRNNRFSSHRGRSRDGHRDGLLGLGLSISL